MHCSNRPYIKQSAAGRTNRCRGYDHVVRIATRSRKSAITPTVSCKKWHPEPITTFVIGRNINYTNICDMYCRFCAFYRPPGSEEGYVLPDEEIFQKIQETVDVGGTEILMQGGANPDLPFEYYMNLLASDQQRFPNITMHSFSTCGNSENAARFRDCHWKEVLRELNEAGLDSLPGGGAEILDDRTRRRSAA